MVLRDKITRQVLSWYHVTRISHGGYYNINMIAHSVPACNMGHFTILFIRPGYQVLHVVCHQNNTNTYIHICWSTIIYFYSRCITISTIKYDFRISLIAQHYLWDCKRRNFLSWKRLFPVPSYLMDASIVRSSG